LALGIIAVLTVGEYVAVARLVDAHMERTADIQRALRGLIDSPRADSLAPLLAAADAGVARIQRTTVLMTGASLLGLILVGALILEPMVRRMDRKRRTLENAIDELRHLSSLDGLTGVLNRRSFDERLEREWRRAGRDAASIAVLMVDIDHFKRYNDHYGHQAGDACLQRLARALGGTVARPADLVARYGGEEFAIILPDTDLDGAARVGETARLTVDGLALPHAASRVAPHVTISVGVAATVPAGQLNAADLVAAADRALYRAKQGGRNRVEREPVGERAAPGPTR